MVGVCQTNMKEGVESTGVKDIYKGVAIGKDHGVLPSKEISEGGTPR